MMRKTAHPLRSFVLWLVRQLERSLSNVAAPSRIRTPKPFCDQPIQAVRAR
jgi:hypothetical protein